MREREGAGGWVRDITEIRRSHPAERTQRALEAVEDKQRAGLAQAAQKLVGLLARAEAAWVAAEVLQRVAQEAVEAGRALVEAPPGDARPARRFDLVQQPVPGQRALAEAAQRTQ